MWFFCEGEVGKLKALELFGPERRKKSTPMISDENLKQLRELMTEVMTTVLEAYGIKKPAARVAEGAAERMRRYRDRKRNASVTRRNGKRNAAQRGKRNANVTHGNASVTGAVNGEAVGFIPIVGGAEYGVSKALLAELEAAYPDVDGPGTLKEIRAWCITNPGKRKTANGVPRFLNGWFERLQNKG